MPAPDTYKFGNQEFKMNVRDTQEIPLEWGGKLVVCNCIVGGAIDARFIPAIVKGLMDRMEQGPLTGSYARDVRVCIYDGKMHPRRLQRNIIPTGRTQRILRGFPQRQSQDS